MEYIKLILLDPRVIETVEDRQQEVRVDFWGVEAEFILSLVRVKSNAEGEKTLHAAFKSILAPADVCRCPGLADVWRRYRDPLVALASVQDYQSLSTTPNRLINQIISQNRQRGLRRSATTVERYLAYYLWLPFFELMARPTSVIRQKVEAMRERKAADFIQTPLEQAMVDYLAKISEKKIV